MAQLIVNDGTLESLPATVTVTTLNSRPVANAGPDQPLGSVGQTVQLDGSSSSDADGDPLTFRWALTTRPAGSQATLSNATLVNPTFVADVLGTYVAQLIVNDGTLESNPDTVTVSTSVLIVECISGAQGGDQIFRGFYIPNYPGTSLARVELFSWRARLGITPSHSRFGRIPTTACCSGRTPQQ